PYLMPRCDLLQQAQGSMYTRHGKATIHWECNEDNIILSGKLPHTMQAKLILPNTQATVKIKGEWHHTIHRKDPCETIKY
ncbi:MAG: alpha-L-rhamnosidase C-terminal domain-containing protein, partial [Phycisphaeraceae bacterium JB051]